MDSNDVRWGNVPADQIDTAIYNEKSQNTKNNEKYTWNQFRQFCVDKNYVFSSSTSKIELAEILRDWAYNMRKSNGDDYKESVVKTLWNSTAKQLQQLYFREHNIILNPFTDIEFKTARDARDTKRKELQKSISKRKKSAVAFTVAEKLKIQEQWNEDTPVGLQRKTYHVISMELAWRGGEAARLMMDHFKKELDNFGNFTGRIEYNPIFSKTAQGGAQKLTDSKYLVPNKENVNLCPVRLYEKLLSKRPLSLTTNRFFLTPNPNWDKTTNRIWYKNCPVGKNEIFKWTRDAAKNIGMDTENVKITNHSNRSTAVTHLAKAGVSDQQLIQITGHSSTSSIQPYLQMDKPMHESLIDKMRTTSSATSTVNACISSSNNSQNETTSNAGNIFKNCTFNIENFNC